MPAGIGYAVGTPAVLNRDEITHIWAQFRVNEGNGTRRSMSYRRRGVS
jgi:hypothetical protein